MTETIIGFNKLKICCIIGINPDERVKEQEIAVSISMSINRFNQNKEDLSSTIDYTWLAKLSECVAKKGKYLLLETYIDDLICEIEKNKTYNWIHLTVEKPQAIESCLSAFVEVRKKKHAMDSCDRWC